MKREGKADTFFCFCIEAYIFPWTSYMVALNASNTACDRSCELSLHIVESFSQEWTNSGMAHMFSEEGFPRKWGGNSFEDFRLVFLWHRLDDYARNHFIYIIAKCIRRNVPSDYSATELRRCCGSRFKVLIFSFQISSFTFLESHWHKSFFSASQAGDLPLIVVFKKCVR